MIKFILDLTHDANEVSIKIYHDEKLVDDLILVSERPYSFVFRFVSWVEDYLDEAGLVDQEYFTYVRLH